MAIHDQYGTYPLGKNYWKVQILNNVFIRDFTLLNFLFKVFNDTKCAYQNTDSLHLNLSPCNSSSFTCDDGICIPMSRRCVLRFCINLILVCRCDQQVDCEDISDERGCKLVVLDEKNYLKDKPPRNAKVKMRIELMKILEIGEVEMLFRVKFALSMEWFDSRITFHNLHGNQLLNTLIDDEKQRIWTPTMIFVNTDESTRTTTDKKSLISVKREGNLARNTIKSVDNVHVYDGAENPMEMNRVYHTSWFLLL